MARTRQPLETKRRMPRQARAEETVAAILEGAAQILEAGGLAAFTTNAVAERAGVGMGTVYQYFADKNGLIRALAQRELQVTLTRVRQALLGEIDPTPEGRVRVMIRAMITAFRGRQRARKAVLQALLSRGGGVELMAPVAAFLAETEARIGQQPQRVFAMLDRRQLFVVSRALMGAIRAAVLEEQPFLRDQAFEDELVRLVMAYLGVVPAA